MRWPKNQIRPQLEHVRNMSEISIVKFPNFHAFLNLFYNSYFFKAMLLNLPILKSISFHVNSITLL